MTKRVLAILAILVIAVGSLLPAATLAQGPEGGRVQPANRTAPTAIPGPDWGGTWQFGTDTAFQFTRFDGGYYPGDGRIYFMGGRLADSNTDGSVWYYDPATDTYADTSVDLVTPISNYQMNLLQDGSGDWAFYVLCGRPAPGGVITAVQAYYPDTNTAVQLDPADDYPGPTVACTSGLNAVYNNVVWTAGGFDGTGNHGETWTFDPTAPVGSKWTQIPTANLNLARAYIMSAVVDDMIYAIGGAWFDGANLINVTMVEVLYPNAANPVWDDAAVADLPEECSSSRAYGFDSDSPYVDPDGTPFAGTIVSGCGFWADENNHVYVYDVGLDYWDVFPYLNIDRRDHAAEFLPAGPIAGMPGMWVWGGRQDSDANVLVSSEYYEVISGTAPCSILLVDDDWDQYSGEPYNGTGTYYYTSTLEALGYGYDRWDVWTQGDPALADLQGYDVVVWFAGYAWEETITATNEADLAAYLDGGGGLLLSAEDYLYDQGLTSFGNLYLGIDSYTDDPSEVDPIGNAGDPVGDGLGPYTLEVPTSWPVGGTMYTDYVIEAAFASAPFRFEGSGINNSTDYDSGGFKSVFLAWPIEGLDNLSDRMDVMGAALDWLCVSGPPPAMELIPPGDAASGIPGAEVVYDLTVINNLGWDETFTITTSAVWPVEAPATIGPVMNGMTADFVVTVTVPTDANCLEQDTAAVMAQAQSAPAMSDTSYLATSVEPAGVGIIEGTVYDANTGLPIENAFIELVLTYYDYTYDYMAWTDVDGNYTLADVNACTYELFKHNAFGYYNDYGSISVMAGMTHTVAVSLNAAIPDLSATDVYFMLPPTSTGTFDLLLTNNGTGDLTFHVSEVPPDGIYPVPLGRSGIDAQVYADLAASPDGRSEFVVYMAEQADLSAAFGMDWEMRGDYVLNALRSTAARTQAGLLASLDAAGVSYESRYIVNAIAVEGDINLAQSIAARPEVAYIGPNTEVPAPEPVEMGPAIDEMVNVVWNVAQVNADDVWTDFGAYGDGIVVANIDTGVQYTHTALVQQYRGNLGGGSFDHNYNWWDPYGDQPDAPYDYHAHGSHTIGTMVGSDDPANPISATNGIGLAPHGQWIACNGFWQGGSGYEAELLECAEFLLAPWDLTGANPDPGMRPHVINNSWGGGGADWWYNQAIYAWRAAGIFANFSAGNAGPACETVGAPDYANILLVGATDSTDHIADFSSRGPADVSGIMKPDVSAPGVNVISAYNNGGYGPMSGTSMASPHVAGLAALLWSAQPELIGNVQQTYWVIEHSAMAITTTEGCGGDTPDDVPNNTYGWGRIDAWEAVNMALGANWDTPWLDVDPAQGVVAPDDTATIGLNFDSTGLEPTMCYTTTLKIEFNDPYVTETFVPVEFCITEGWTVYLPLVNKGY